MTHLKKGYIQVYTGNGKGKTTAALGLALRAAGRGMKVYIGQFMKGQEYGELEAVNKYLSRWITMEQYGTPKFVVGKPSEEDVRLAHEGLERARKAMLSGEYDIIILDEINVSIYLKTLELSEVLDFIKEKPENVELILTGRYAPQEIIDAADLVTEMREIKHYYTKGVIAREGIEK